jgi:hypothetical protein
LESQQADLDFAPSVVAGSLWHSLAFRVKKAWVPAFPLTEVLSLVSSLLDESRLTREIAP